MNMQNIHTFYSRLVNTPSRWSFQRFDGAGYVCVSPSNGRGHPKRNQYERLTPELISEHIAGDITLSAGAIDEVFSGRWCCWDSDIEDGTLAKVDELLKELGLNALREGSRPGRDGHLWLLLDQPIPCTDLLRFHDIIAQTIPEVSALEFFPKSLSWSQVRLPLGINRKPDADGARGWFAGAPSDIDAQLEWFAEQPLNSPQPVLRVARYAEAMDRQKLEDARAARGHARREETEYEPIDLLEHQDLLIGLRNGDTRNYKCQCPSCAASGGDMKARNNLSINRSDGTRFQCWAGCGAREILQCLGLR